LGIEMEPAGLFDPEHKMFNFTIRSKYGCPKEIGHFSLVFHKNKVIIILLTLILGIFCNFWGIKNLKFTLKLIGFFLSFLITYLLIATIIIDGVIISNSPSLDNNQLCHCNYSRSHRSGYDIQTRRASQQNFQSVNKLAL
jgi:hypothetical protein